MKQYDNLIVLRLPSWLKRLAKKHAEEQGIELSEYMRRIIMISDALNLKGTKGGKENE